MSKYDAAYNHLVKAKSYIEKDFDSSLYEKTRDKYRNQMYPLLLEIVSTIEDFLDIEYSDVSDDTCVDDRPSAPQQSLDTLSLILPLLAQALNQQKPAHYATQDRQEPKQSPKKSRSRKSSRKSSGKRSNNTWSSEYSLEFKYCFKDVIRTLKDESENSDVLQVYELAYSWYNARFFCHIAPGNKKYRMSYVPGWFSILSMVFTVKADNPCHINVALYEMMNAWIDDIAENPNKPYGAPYMMSRSYLVSLFDGLDDDRCSVLVSKCRYNWSVIVNEFNDCARSLGYAIKLDENLVDDHINSMNLV